MSRNRVEKRPQAIRDLADIAGYLAEESFESLAGFPNHLFFYRPIERVIEVIRVLHAKRDIESLFGGRG